MQCPRCKQLGFSNQCFCHTLQDDIAYRSGATHKDAHKTGYYYQRLGARCMVAVMVNCKLSEWSYYGSYEPMSAVIL